MAIAIVHLERRCRRRFGMYFSSPVSSVPASERPTNQTSVADRHAGAQYSSDIARSAPDTPALASADGRNDDERHLVSVRALVIIHVAELSGASTTELIVFRSKE
jgi:hypothetical protein